MRHSHITALIVISLLGLATGPLAHAERFRRHCLDGDTEGLFPAPSMMPIEDDLPVDSEPGQTHIEADAMELEREGGMVTFTGDVQVQQNQRQMRADQVRFDRNTNQLDAEGNTAIEQPGLRITGRSAHMNLDDDTGTVEEIEYFFTDTPGRGRADRAEIDSAVKSRYRNIEFTTCKPGNEDWMLSANKLKVNRDTGIGEANNVTLRFQGVPLLYSPYLNFSIDGRRKSGLLAPTFGNSEETGLDITIPYYFNIAPNLDATLAPRILSKRGLLLGGEFRYLEEKFFGKVRGELIPGDDDYAADPGATRGILSLEHVSRFNPRLTGTVNFNYASDDAYLEDFGGSLGIASTRNLERRADLNYRDKEWSLLTRVQAFQTIDRGIPMHLRPYDRLPQVLLQRNVRERNHALNWDLEAEYSFFDHEVNEYGSRIAVEPSVSFPMRQPWGFLVPEARMYYTRYALSDRGDNLHSSPHLLVPSFNLDGGLIFERPAHWLGRTATQTLEPRLYYLYTPYKDQDVFPDFDTEELDFSYSNLFRNNRFTGRDRVGDANQLTLGLTSRTLSNESGRELFRASIGQILYFRDRDVQLTGTPEDDSSSSFALEVAAQLNDNWQARGGVQWNPHLSDEQVEDSLLELHYQTPEDRIFNIAYRFRRDDVEDLDFSFRWPLSHRLQLVGRVNYSLRYDQTMESFAGIEYRKCCWGMRLVTRHYVNEPNGTADTAIMFQLELNGLGNLGQRVDELLEEGIYGYQID